MTGFTTLFLLVLASTWLSACSSLSKTNNIRGLNWADERDNYSSGYLYLSGIEDGDTYDIVKSKAENILGSLISLMAINTVRLPINPPTILGSWFSSYAAAIDVAISKNMNVILGYWEADDSKDGKVDNMDEFYKMWEVIIDKYGKFDSVYFEIFNEPFGYSAKEWTDLSFDWITKFSQVPHNRVVVSGTGYNDHLGDVGKDSRLKDCLLSLHIYPYWNTGLYTVQGWKQEVVTRVAGYYNRAIISEYGAPMTTNINYSGPINNNNNIAFMYAIPEQVCAYQMGSVYWPGLRNDDSYSITKLIADFSANSNHSLEITNESGANRIKAAYC